MTTGWKRVYVFISSTFNDMHAERDYLVKRVFPQLREWCERRKLRLVDVDLRWGVTEADATGHRNVLRTCLKRIDDCRPFFVCFLGQRRGWVPSKDEVSPETFESFPGAETSVEKKESVTEMEIRHALIEPMHGHVPHDPEKPDEYYLHAKHAFFYLRDPSYLEHLPHDPPMLRQTYTNECIADLATRAVHEAELKRWREKEIPETAKRLNRPVRSYNATWDASALTPELALPLQCPFEPPRKQDQEYWRAKNIERWRNEWAKAGVSVAGLNVEDDPAEAEKARRFNERFTAGRLTGLKCEREDLGEVLLRDLQKGITARYPDNVEVEGEKDLQKEIDQHEEFLFINSEGFFERPGAFDELDKYIREDSRKTFVLTAEGGMGKSVLLANWIDRCREDEARFDKFFFRFVGQSDRSTTVPNLIHYLLRQLQEAGKVPATTNETVKNPDGSESTREVPLEIPQDPAKLYLVWREQLEHLGRHGKAVIVIDAINQLESGLRDLFWVPLNGLSDNVKFIISFKTGEQEANDLLGRLNANQHVQCDEVKPFETLTDRHKLVKAYLSQYLKELDDRHTMTIIQAKGAGNPLFLKVVLSELRVFGAFAQLANKIRDDFGDDPVSAFGAVLRRLETDPVYSRVKPAEAVPLLFELLAHARHGLSANELTDLFLTHLDLDRDQQAGRDGTREAVHLFLRQVQPFLARRDGRYDFFYESFLLAARNRYVGEPTTDAPYKRPAAQWHGMLAEYFNGLDWWTESPDDQRTRAKRLPPTPRPANVRKVTALAWHRLQIGELASEEGKVDEIERAWAAMEELFTDLSFLEAKTEAGLVFDLVTDFAQAIRVMPSDRPQHSILRLLEEAVRRDIHFIARHPTTLFQCLWNSCWWYDCPETAKHSATPNTVSFLLRLLRTVARLIRIRKADSHSRRSSTIPLWKLLERWRAKKQQVTPHFPWLRSLRPPPVHLYGHDAVVLRSDGSSAMCVAYSFDGSRIASGHRNGTIRIWDATTGKELHSMRVPRSTKAMLHCLAFSPDGTHILSASTAENFIRLWDAATGAHTGTIQVLGGTQHISIQGTSCDTGIPWGVQYFAYSPNGRHMVVATANHCCLFDVSRQIQIWRTQLDDIITCAEFCNDGDRVACSMINGPVRVCGIHDGRTLFSLTGHKGPVWSISTARVPSLIASGGDDGTVRVWDATSGAERLCLKNPADHVHALAFSPNGERLAVGASDGTVRFFNTKRWTEMNCTIRYEGVVHSVAFSPRQPNCVTASADGTMLIVNPTVLRTPARFSDDTGGPIVCACHSPKGMYYVTTDGTNICVWNTTTGAIASRSLTATPRNPVRALAFSNDQSTIASVSDVCAFLWNHKKGKITKCVQSSDQIDPLMGVRFSPDDKWVVAEGYDSAHIWSAYSGQELTGSTLRHSVGFVAFSSDSRWIVTHEGVGDMWIWDCATATRAHLVKGHTGCVVTGCFSKNGKLFASSSEDGTVRIWKVDNWVETQRLSHSQRTARHIAFSPDSSQIVTSGGVAMVWDVKTGRVVLRLGEIRAVLYLLTYTRDGRGIVCQDGRNFSELRFRVWDSKSGRPLQLDVEDLRPPDAAVKCCWAVRNHYMGSAIESRLTSQVLGWYPHPIVVPEARFCGRFNISGPGSEHAQIIAGARVFGNYGAQAGQGRFVEILVPEGLQPTAISAGNMKR